MRDLLVSTRNKKQESMDDKGEQNMETWRSITDPSSFTVCHHNIMRYAMYVSCPY